MIPPNQSYNPYTQPINPTFSNNNPFSPYINRQRPQLPFQYNRLAQQQQSHPTIKKLILFATATAIGVIATKNIKLNSTSLNIIKDGVKIAPPDKTLFSAILDKIALTTEDLRIRNFHKIDDKLFRGAAPDSEEAFKALKENGVDTIIDLRGSHSTNPEQLKYEEYFSEKYLSQNSIPAYHHLEMSAKTPPTEKQILELFDIIKNAKGKVFIHCKSGIDRTGIMSALYEIQTKGITPEEAFKHMQGFGYNFIHQHGKASIQKDFLFDTSKWQPILNKVTNPSLRAND